MKRILYLLLFVFTMSISLTSLSSCREEEKKPAEKVEDAFEDAGDEIEEGVEEIEDEIDDATDDN